MVNISRETVEIRIDHGPGTRPHRYQIPPGGTQDFDIGYCIPVKGSGQKWLPPIVSRLSMKNHAGQPRARLVPKDEAIRKHGWKPKPNDHAAAEVLPSEEPEPALAGADVNALVAELQALRAQNEQLKQLANKIQGLEQPSESSTLQKRALQTLRAQNEDLANKSQALEQFAQTSEPPTPKKRASRNWMEIIQDFARSGKTATKFCQERNIPLATFSAARKRLAASMTPTLKGKKKGD